MKMIAIGLGKQKGAEFFHSQGMDEFHLIPRSPSSRFPGQYPVWGRRDREWLREPGPGRGCACGPYLGTEQELLKIARERMGRLPGERIDVLIVDRIGKDISGDGADPNVINRDVAGVLPRRKSRSNLASSA